MPIIDIATVRALVSAEIFNRGRDYARSGAVGRLTRRGDVVSVEVEGSDAAPYRVKIRLSETGFADATCTCPYEWGNYCKHVAATLICLAERPDDVHILKPLSEILSDLDNASLLALVLRRTDVDEDFALWLDAELEIQRAIEPKKAAKRKCLVDQAPIKSYAHALIHGRYRPRRHRDDFRVSGSAEELRSLVEKATPFLDQGDGRNALRVLEAVAETFVDAWLDDGHADDEEVYLLFDDLGRLIAEAALLSDLAPEERDAVAQTIELWHARLSDFGVEEAFPVAIRALEEGWDDATLQKVLEGKARTLPRSAEPLGQALVDVRLRVLKACERFEEYLNLSRAGGAHALHAGMLAELGRLNDAVDYARGAFKSSSEAHDFAKILRTQAHDAAALAMAEFGLALGESNELQAERDTQADGVHGANRADHGATALANWLRDYAGALGDAKLALKAAMFAFARTHSSRDFRAAERWAKVRGAGRTWPSVRKTMLTQLQAAAFAYDRVKILLDENMIDAAIIAAGANGDRAGGNETLMRLAGAAAASNPDWVIRVTRARADAIMNEGRSGHYAEAAHWLELASHAYLAADSEEEWRAILEHLVETHKRKHKLRRLLEGLR